MSGVFKCQKHDFECDEPKDWREHLAEEEHTRRGTAPCNMCGTANEFVFTGKIVGKEPSLCKDCAKTLMEGTDGGPRAPIHRPNFSRHGAVVPRFP